ncbi:MmcQ/YjbR family DNA-binding protein [Variovorax robiniae]|uniref:MmcQ/YjbR family DNA-binding protein n=1 Tax=Variovorax robiniae TaxID=1836199 RepID=A0ABU8XK74_9BURK
MKFAPVRTFALSLPEVTEEPHHHFGSFRVRGKIFVTIPPEQEHIHVFVPEQQREQALAMYPSFAEKLLWGSKVVGLKVALAGADPRAIKALVRAAWQHKAPKALQPPNA